MPRVPGGLTVQVRYLTCRDLPRVVEIEAASFEFVWTERDFLRELRGQSVIAMVAERDGVIVGFMVYELHKSGRRLPNLAVDPACRRLGVGRQLVARLIDKVGGHETRKSIALAVRETNLGAQLFFRRQGFLAIDVLRACGGLAERVYLMVRGCRPIDEARRAFRGANRIMQHLPAGPA